MAHYCPRSGCEWWRRADERDQRAVLPGVPPGVCVKPHVVFELAGTGGAMFCTNYRKSNRRRQWMIEREDPVAVDRGGSG